MLIVWVNSISSRLFSNLSHFGRHNLASERCVITRFLVSTWLIQINLWLAHSLVVARRWLDCKCKNVVILLMIAIACILTTNRQRRLRLVVVSAHRHIRRIHTRLVI